MSGSFRVVLIACGFFAGAGVLSLFLLQHPAKAQVAVAHERATPPGVTYHSVISAAQRRVFFGELHLHTTLSYDAWAYGTKITPAQAYAFGRGETIAVPASQVEQEEGLGVNADVPVRRAWPLDFMAVTDHAEYIGVNAQLDQPNNPLRKSALGQMMLLHPFFSAFTDDPAAAARFGFAVPPQLTDPGVERDAWDEEKRAAETYNRPGVFTTFIAYEWTSTPGGKNLHRNVIFNGDDAPPPFTSLQSTKPEDLWTYVEGVRARGEDAIAIPHNGDASGGLMYDWNASDGRPIDEAYAQRRATNEPLTEIYQNKGQSETLPVLSPNDEFANFEVVDHLLTGVADKSDPNGSYIRQAYGRGLVIQARVGVNPFKYGLVGGADIHNGLSDSDESATSGGNFATPGAMMPTGDKAKRILGVLPPISRTEGLKGTPAYSAPPVSAAEVTQQNQDAMKAEVERGSSGLTGVWAEENTRNSIFAALKRKETFATSGTRIRVRMFGGWDFAASMLNRADWVAQAYVRGVPMGGDLPSRPAAGERSPAFILQAMKGPDGANLDRIQVVKVWLDGGDYREKVFDVALSNGRTVDLVTGKAVPIANTVDQKSGANSNRVGAAILSTVWRDPEFDAKTSAVYYARVLEIPSPRWSTLLAIKNHLPLSPLVPATIQERAWSSPIWYTPAALPTASVEHQKP